MRIRGFQWNVNCNGLAPPLDIPASYFVFLWRDNLSLGTEPVQCFSWFDQLALFKAFVHQDGNSLSCQVFLGHEISSRSSIFDGRGAGFLYKKGTPNRFPLKKREGTLTLRLWLERGFTGLVSRVRWQLPNGGSDILVVGLAILHRYASAGSQSTCPRRFRSQSERHLGRLAASRLRNDQLVCRDRSDRTLGEMRCWLGCFRLGKGGRVARRFPSFLLSEHRRIASLSPRRSKGIYEA